MLRMEEPGRRPRRPKRTGGQLVQEQGATEYKMRGTVGGGNDSDGDLGGPGGPEVSHPCKKCPEKEVSKVKG